MKNYFRIDGKENEFVKVTTGYEKGGTNYYNGQNNRRGYYIYAQKVERVNRGGYVMESCTMFEGGKKLLKEVGRQSKKAELEAEQQAEQNKLDFIRQVYGDIKLEI